MIWLILKYTLFILLGFGLSLALGILTGMFIRAGRGKDDIAW